MIVGTPVVTTRVGGLAEAAQHGLTGGLVALGTRARPPLECSRCSRGAPMATPIASSG